MAINLDTAFGVHAQALTLRAKRAQVLANNIANADTTVFKACDMDFRAVMEHQLPGGSQGVALSQTQKGHMTLQSVTPNFDLQYRQTAARLDGNNVQLQRGVTDYTENNVANSSTTGFKSSRAEFTDVYASSALGTSSTAIGNGVKLSSVTQMHHHIALSKCY